MHCEASSQWFFVFAVSILCAVQFADEQLNHAFHHLGSVDHLVWTICMGRNKVTRQSDRDDNNTCDLGYFNQRIKMV